MKNINALLILMLLISLVPRQSLFAQEEPTIEDLFEMSLEELMNVKVVTAGKYPQKIISVPATLSTITADEIRMSGAVNLAEVLRTTTGIIISRHPGNFPQYRTIIRGFSSEFINERTLIMIDGVPIYHPHPGGIDPGWISLSYIKRIEVIKGPVSALYGANAFGGLINIITKSGTDKSSFGAMNFMLKSRQYLDNHKTIFSPYYSANVGGSRGKLNYFFAVDGFLNKDGYMKQHQGQENIDAFGKVGIQFNEQTKFQALAMISKDRQRIGFDNAPDPLENDLIHVTANVESKITKNYTLIFRTYLNNFKNYVKYDNELSKFESPGKVVGAELQNTFHLGKENILIIGGDFRKDEASMTTWEFDWNAGYPPPIKQA
ncbi:MAG: TonB-dependent receptor plug domain-containing protein, partial [Calditrichia bacterium]|nr:TonB-dependent receptor plug domain-containing protein [Calditrichia bacterium]